jgi:hypothetical protein
VTVCMLFHVLMEKFFRRIIFMAARTPVPLHCKKPHHILNTFAHGKTHHTIQTLHKHEPALKHYLKFQLSLSSVFVCVPFYMKLYNLRSEQTRRIQWCWNFVLFANSPPHVGQPTTFSWVWLRIWSANLLSRWCSRLEMHPATRKSLCFSFRINLFAHLFRNI